MDQKPFIAKEQVAIILCRPVHVHLVGVKIYPGVIILGSLYGALLIIAPGHDEDL